MTNSISYINRNRDKHNLPPSDELQKIISGFIVDKDRAYAPQYKGGFDVIIGNPPYLRMQGLIKYLRQYIPPNPLSPMIVDILSDPTVLMSLLSKSHLSP